MLTVDFDRFPVGPGDRVLDLGCGAGRHAFEAYRRGADVVALDRDDRELADVAEVVEEMAAKGEAPPTARASIVRGDVLQLPFPTASFDRVIAAEVFEHIHQDGRAMTEVARVLKPGGVAAVTVPRWLPERICWLLSDAYHDAAGGHVRIYRRDALVTRLAAAGLAATGTHHAHALHTPYWWLKCLIGLDREAHPLPRLYHRLLVWDIEQQPWLTRKAERLLDPLLGKSLVVYLQKPARAGVERGHAAA